MSAAKLGIVIQLFEKNNEKVAKCRLVLSFSDLFNNLCEIISAVQILMQHHGLRFYKLYNIL